MLPDTSGNRLTRCTSGQLEFRLSFDRKGVGRISSRMSKYSIVKIAIPHQLAQQLHDMIVPHYDSVCNSKRATMYDNMEVALQLRHTLENLKQLSEETAQ